MQETFIILKPDAMANPEIKQAVINTIIDLAQEVTFKQVTPTKELIEAHYQHLIDKPFFPNLLNFMVGQQVIIARASGDNIISAWRDVLGATNPKEANVGTLRHTYGSHEDVMYNVAHGSDSKESAEREIGLWFK